MAKFPRLINNGVITTPPNAWETVSADVVGRGIYNVDGGANLEFLYGVGPGQTINVSNKHPGGPFIASHLDIDDVADFRGQINLSYVVPPLSHAVVDPQQVSSIGLVMVSKAVDSYSYRDDRFKLWNGNTVVDTLRLELSDPFGITVQDAPGGWIFISADTGTQHGSTFLGSIHPPAMPEHMGTPEHMATPVHW